MPKYVYHCEKCLNEFEAHHGMKEEFNICILCEEKNSIHRIPQLTSVIHKDGHGQLVKDSIEENKKILKQMKKESREFKK